MTEEQFQEIITLLLKEGINITLSVDKAGVRWYDLNTMMKSHMYIAYEASTKTAKYEGRYDRSGTFDDLDELLQLVRGCLCGRDFANCSWLDLLHKREIVWSGR